MQATVLSIAGSDPTGGAGIQADLKTMTSIGVYGAAAVTCITVQNSHGVVKVECLSPGLVHEQVRAVLDDHRVTHVKIGMVGNAAVAEAISAALAGFTGEVMYDPVTVSSTGQSLLEGGRQETYAHLVARCTVLTPNIPELGQLAGTPIGSHQDALVQAGRLLAQYARLRAILVKGGHAIQDGKIIDTLLLRSNDGPRPLPAAHAAITSRNTHGTGCTLASAFASFHCLSGDDIRSFRQSVAYVQTLLENSAPARIVRNRQGRGGLLHFTFSPGNSRP